MNDSTKNMELYRSHGSSVSVANDGWLDKLSLTCGKGRNCSVYHCIQTGCGSYPSFYPAAVFSSGQRLLCSVKLKINCK